MTATGMRILLLFLSITVFSSTSSSFDYSDDEADENDFGSVAATTPTARTDNYFPIPTFRMDPTSRADCESIVTTHCFVFNYSLCTLGLLRVCCTSAATNQEVQSFFMNIKKLNKDLPILMILGGPRVYSASTFEPVRSNILLLDIIGYDGVNSRAIKNINLPNLVQLFFTRCDNVIIGKDDLTAFRHLREISFWNSSVSSIEEGSFDTLVDLKLIALDGKMSPPFRPEQQEHLRRFHCSSEYRWLRKFFEAHPVLIQPKVPGDLYSLQKRIVNSQRNATDIFVPVDCKKDDLLGRLTQNLFSVNVHIEKEPLKRTLLVNSSPTLSSDKCCALKSLLVVLLFFYFK